MNFNNHIFFSPKQRSTSNPSTADVAGHHALLDLLDDFGSHRQVSEIPKAARQFSDLFGI